MSENRSGGDRGIDPVTLEVVRNACVAVSEEMNANLVRTAYSPNIKDRKDCSCAVFDSSGEMVSQAENIPVHLGAMPFSVEAAIARFDGSLNPGDSVVLNDPYHGGAHLPDITLVTPVFISENDGNLGSSGGDGDECELVGYVANRAHHADVGGSLAGSVSSSSTEIYEEGFRIPPVKLVETGEYNQDVLDLILANTRTPEERKGDLRAQVAANNTGVERFGEIASDHKSFDELLEEVKNYSERRMRSEIDSIPDGTYSFEDVLDSDGKGNENLRIAVEVVIEGDSLVVDFSGTADQTQGPLNAVFAVTASAVYYAVRCVTDPDIPPNHGCYRPIEIKVPENSLVNPSSPAPVVGGNIETSQRITDVVLGAFSSAVPEKAVGAGQGTMNNITFGGTRRDGTPYTFYETLGGGFGASAETDGMDGVHVHMSNTLNTPVEVIETTYPLRVRRYEYRSDSGGPGERRGGLGLRRDIEVKSQSSFSIIADRRRNNPYGVQGGRPGEVGDDFIIKRKNEEKNKKKIDSKSTHTLKPGDVVSIRTPGGGGYGNPEERPEGLVFEDLRNEKISEEAAREVYGVDIGD